MNATAPSYQVEQQGGAKGGAAPSIRRPRTSWALLTQAPLHDFPVRDEILLQYLPLQPEMDVAEVGVGTGFTSCWLAGQARSYTGIDVSAATVERLRTKLQHLGNAEFFLRPWAKAVYTLLHEWPIGLYRSRHRAKRTSEERPQIYEDTWAFQNGQRLNRYRTLLHLSWAVLGVLMRLCGPVYGSHELSGDQNLLGRQLLIRAWK
jgi:SAM-dependent methyltransferase